MGAAADRLCRDRQAAAAGTVRPSRGANDPARRAGRAAARDGTECRPDAGAGRTGGRAPLCGRADRTRPRRRLRRAFHHGSGAAGRAAGRSPCRLLDRRRAGHAPSARDRHLCEADRGLCGPRPQADATGNGPQGDRLSGADPGPAGSGRHPGRARRPTSSCSTPPASAPARPSSSRCVRRRGSIWCWSTAARLRGGGKVGAAGVLLRAR